MNAGSNPAPQQASESSGFCLQNMKRDAVENEDGNW